VLGMLLKIRGSTLFLHTVVLVMSVMQQYTKMDLFQQLQPLQDLTGYGMAQVQQPIEILELVLLLETLVVIGMVL